MGNSERKLGSPRHPRPSGRLRQPLDRADGTARQAALGLAGPARGQVLRLEEPLREGQRAQRPDPPRLVAGGLGEAGDPRLSPPAPRRRLPALDLHDARRGRRGGQPGHRLPRAFAGRSARPTLGQALEKGHGLRPAPAAPPALAHRHQLPQHRRHVLLPHQHPRRLQPLHRPLGHPRRG